MILMFKFSPIENSSDKQRNTLYYQCIQPVELGRVKGNR